MNEFPPPQLDDAAAAQADRLAALAARRAGSSARADAGRTTTRPTSTNSNARVRDRLAASATNTSPATPSARTSPAGGTPTRRRHPAKGARAAALGLSLASTGGLAALFAVTGATAGSQVQAAQIVSAAPAATSAGATGPASTTPAPVVDQAAAPAPVTAPAAATGTASTTAPTPMATNTVVNGGVFHNKWGDVQVQATFAPDGSLVDVTTLQTPTRDGKSVRINDRAVPRLNAEALAAQSASVDTVSGATYTSTDYRRSLQSAIDAAVDAGLVVATA